jgi:hypothetical protein
LTINLIFGQDFRNELVIKDFLNKLTDTKIDTVLIYENGVVGSSEPFVLVKNDSCFMYGETQFSYVIWRKNNLDFITKLSTNDCYTYDTIQYDFESIWKMYFEKKQNIKTEKIYLPKYIEGTDTLTIGLDHYSFSQFMFINNNDTVEFEVSDFDLSKIINGKFENLNFEKNKETNRNLLRDMIDNEIKIIEGKNLIDKKKRFTTKAHMQ